MDRTEYERRLRGYSVAHRSLRTTRAKRGRILDEAVILTRRSRHHVMQLLRGGGVSAKSARSAGDALPC